LVFSTSGFHRFPATKPIGSDRQVAVALAHSRLRPRAAKRRAGPRRAGECHLTYQFVRDPFCCRKQLRQREQGLHPPAQGTARRVLAQNATRPAVVRGRPSGEINFSGRARAACSNHPNVLRTKVRDRMARFA
jgi:hypothetical protein